MKSWTRISVCVLALLFALGGQHAFAQFSSGIQGIVHDTSGAVIANAKITVTDIRLGVSKTAESGQDGYFRIDGIAASTYSVEIQMAGFQTWKQDGLALQIAEVRTINPELKVGAVSTSVEVSASAAAVDLETPTTGAIISTETLQQTPLSGQNIYALASIAPGMTGGGIVSGGNDNYTNEYGINLNAAGLRQEENGFQIDDGYTNTPSRGGQTSISPNPEIVESVNVRTNDFDAQKGRNAGATVDVYTKSGSNDFHGTIDYYFLNDTLSGKTHFQNKVPPFTRNEMGATLGGPAIRNRLFWFGAIDVLRSSNPNSYTATVETQDFFNWAKSNLPGTIGTQILSMAPPQTYPTTGLETVAAYEATTGTPGYYAPPAGIPATMNIIGTIPVSYSAVKNGYQWSFRVDDYIGSSDRLYVDVIRTRYDGPGGGTRPASVQGNSNSSDFINFNWTHTFNPRLLNETGMNLIRPYGSNLTQQATEGIPYINVTNLAGFGSWAPGNFTQSTYSWRDVMTAIVKTHTLKFGVDLFNTREVDHQQGAFTRPTFNYRNLLDFIQDEPVYQSGPYVNLQNHQQAPYDRDYRDFIQGYYAQDSWKIGPRFTLTAGVRYDGMVNFFSIYRPTLSRFNLGTGSTWNSQVASGVAALAGTHQVLNHNIGGWTPRLGIAWDPFGTGKTAVRAGFGMFEDQPPYLHITDSTAGNLPNYFNPIVDVTTGNPTPTPFLCTPSGAWNMNCRVTDTSNATIDPHTGALLINGVVQRAGMGGYDPNFKMQQVVAWSLSVQHQLQSNLIAEANYSGTEAHHLLVFNNDINRFAGDLIQNNNTLTRLNPNFAATVYATSNGNSAGHYASAALTRRYKSGLALRGIYTYGKVLDEMSFAQSISSQGPANSDYIQSNNLRAQRGRADFDIRQQFSADGTWDVPNNYSSRALRYILGGWQFGGKWIGYTGLPFTVNNTSSFIPICNGGLVAPVNNHCPAGSTVTGDAGGDYNADGYNYDVPNVPSFGRHLSGQSKNKFLTGIFKSSAFPTPSLGQEGTLGRNTYDSPGYKDFDLTIDKYFGFPWFFGERMKIEAKGEILNLFNRSNLGGVDSHMTDSTFGQSTSQLPARSMQFHLRASF
ncbi:MAG: TonB-dependent receptor domain-containing protein [Acidobacteriota bacterium]